jgi:hypothetical protein
MSNEKQKYCNVGTIPKSNIKIVERGKIAYIHDCSLSWLGTGTSITIVMVTNVLLVK